jgi:hypothetical protein
MTTPQPSPNAAGRSILPCATVSNAIAGNVSPLSSHRLPALAIVASVRQNE